MHAVQESAMRPMFAVGTRVTVKVGVMDPDFPDLQLRDWTGTVSQVQKEGPTSYLIRWSPKTLESVHPAYRDYCRKEDLAFDKMWLLEEDLESALEAPSPLKPAKDFAGKLLPC